MVSKWIITYNLLIDGVYWGYNPLTNLLLTFWDFQVENMQVMGPKSYVAYTTRWAQKRAKKNSVSYNSTIKKKG